MSLPGVLVYHWTCSAVLLGLIQAITVFLELLEDFFEQPDEYPGTARAYPRNNAKRAVFTFQAIPTIQPKQVLLNP